MTHAEEIAGAVSSLIEKGCLPFRRVDVRDELGLSHDEWMSGYTAIFQGMRIDHPGGAPKVVSKYKDVFKRVNRGKYVLTEKGKKIILDSDKTRVCAPIYLPGIPDNIKKKILEQMKRPEGTFSFIGTYDRLWDESKEKGILLQIIIGKIFLRLERDETFNINFYFASPGTGARIATVDAKPLKGISRLQFFLTWSPENIGLYIGALGGKSIFLESSSRKAETPLLVDGDSERVLKGIISYKERINESYSIEKIIYKCKTCEAEVYRTDSICPNGHFLGDANKKIILPKDITDDVIISLLNELKISKDQDEDIYLIATLLKIGKTALNKLIELILDQIEKNNYNATNWIHLANYIDIVLTKPDKSDLIFNKLIWDNEDSSAFYNNYGAFLQSKNNYKEAIQNYAKAYAIDYKEKGHDYASSLSGWKNLVKLSSYFDKIKQSLQELGEILSDDWKKEENKL